MTYMHSYGGEAIFFESLSQGKLLATRCDSKSCEANGTIYIPFRIHCPECLGKNTVIDMTDIAKKTASVHTFMVCARSGAFNLLDKPIRFINIEFDGVATILMSYLSARRTDNRHEGGADLQDQRADLHDPRPVVGAGRNRPGAVAGGVQFLGAVTK